MTKIYAGIGSRRTSWSECQVLTSLASLLESKGYTLRSGGATGADSAFEAGVKQSHLKEIFLASDCVPEAERIASSLHPTWYRCNEHARKLLGRNILILLGRNLDTPVKFVVAWAEESGGTTFTLNAAKYFNIPTYNVARPDEYTQFEHFLPRA